MTTQFRSGRSAPSSFGAVVLALLLGAALAIVLVRHAGTVLPVWLESLLTGRSTRIGETAPIVVNRIQRLQRLETVVYSLDTVVEGSRSSPLLPDLLAGDRLLLIVHGQSVAGIDLAQLRPEDVRVNGQSVHVTLPAAQIFATSLDNQHTRVYTRSTGLLVPADQNLESETRSQAEAQLHKAALDDGILDAARRNAQGTVSALLYSFGFERVEVE